MKNFKLFITIILLIINTGFSQEIVDTVGSCSLFNSSTEVLHSTVVNDDYYIYISLPDDYENSMRTYPVLYVLDGDVTFGMAASIARYLQIGEAIPELIIVGIGYGKTDESPGNKRVRDYSPFSESGKDVANNESKFLEVMKNELMPYIESNYRTKARENTLSGYSLSGLFAFYTFLTEPGLFKNYIIGSPYLAVDNFKILDVQEEVFDKTEDIDARIFISVGSEESDEKYFNPIDEMVTRIEDKGYKSLKMETKVFDGGTHLLCPPEVLSYGLVSVFGK